MPTMRPWLLAAAAYLALAGFLAETRLELADLRRESGAAERRGLSGSDGRWSRAMEELVEAGLGKLRAEGAAAEERLEKQIDSKVADLKNIGAGPYGGAITAALYLNEFVEAPEDGADGGPDEAEETAQPPPWLHLDMMAYNTGSKPGRPEGGEAMGMRALYRLIERRWGSAAKLSG